MNEYFQAGAVPAPNSPGSSAVMRQEFNNIAGAFDKLPILGGHAGEIVVVDPTGTALVTTGSSIGDYVTKDGVFTLTNKTMSWADNTWVGFGTGATKDAGVMAGNVLLLAENNKLPPLDAGNLTNIPGLTLKADANNAVLTGAPVCPTPPLGDSGARIANTQFVSETLQAIGSFAPSNATPLINGTAAPGVSPLGSRSDHVHPVDTSRAPASASTASGTSFTPAGGVAATDVQAAIVELDTEKANLASPAFTGNPTAPTPPTSDNDTSIATTAFVKSVVVDYAPVSSPAFTGNPTAPTPLTSDNDTSIATTAFVQTLVAQQPFGMQPSNSNPLMNGVVGPGTGVEGARYDHVHPTDTSRAPSSAATAAGTSYAPGGGISSTNVQNAITELDNEKAPLDSPTFTGNPTAPTPAVGDSDTSIATTAFVQNVVKGPAFTANINSQAVGTSLQILTATEVTDPNNCFLNNRFTPTVAGWYQVNLTLISNQADNHTAGAIYLNGVQVAIQIVPGLPAGVGGGGYPSMSALVQMNGTSDYIQAYGSISIAGFSIVSGKFSASLARPA